MIFGVLLYSSLLVFGLGLIFRISTWFSRRIGFSAQKITTSKRVAAAARGLLGVICSPKIGTLVKVFFLDVVFQVRILREDPLRWLMHLLISYGFMLLLLMHALGQLITANLFSEYYSTLNPFLFSRDFFGLMVIVGLGIAVYRRFILKVPRSKSNYMDRYAIFVLAVVILSGILMEGLKFTSYSVFRDMVENYAGLDDENEIRALESLWAEKYGLVSPNVKAPFDKETISQGQEIHIDNCADCHSSSRWAFAGYGTSKILRPAALVLDQAGGVRIVFYLHVLACFVGLAYLPFSKMFHIIVTPLSLMANSVMDNDTSSQANILTRELLELDACTHCGTCSRYCSAMMAYEAMGNEYILPSEKMIFLKIMAGGKRLKQKQLAAIQEGVYLCTNCDRCTVVCPSGINLRELWVSVREDLIQKGAPEPLLLSPLSLVRGLNRKKLSEETYSFPLQSAQHAVAGRFSSLIDPSRVLFLQGVEDQTLVDIPKDSTFSYCFGCQNCTTVCPVVQNYEKPVERLGLLPHQIMYCLGLGLTEIAMGARMIWDCLTCYQCQENCPQSVNVTELLYILKNRTVKKLENERLS